MRNRTPDSTTPPYLPLPSAEFPICPLPGEPSESDSWVWFVTEKGLRASGAISMRAAAADLRRTAAELEKAARRLDQQMPAPSNGSGAATSDLGATAPQVTFLGPGRMAQASSGSDQVSGSPAAHQRS